MEDAFEFSDPEHQCQAMNAAKDAMTRIIMVFA